MAISSERASFRCCCFFVQLGVDAIRSGGGGQVKTLLHVQLAGDDEDEDERLAAPNKEAHQIIRFTKVEPGRDGNRLQVGRPKKAGSARQAASARGLRRQRQY